MHYPFLSRLNPGCPGGDDYRAVPGARAARARRAPPRTRRRECPPPAAARPARPCPASPPPGTPGAASPASRRTARPPGCRPAGLRQRGDQQGTAPRVGGGVRGAAPGRAAAPGHIGAHRPRRDADHRRDRRERFQPDDRADAPPPSTRSSARRPGTRPRCPGVPRGPWRARARPRPAARPRRPARARAARMPVTIAAAEEPRPRPCGIEFTQRSPSPGGCPPVTANAARMARTTRWSSPASARSAPSPEISMESPDSLIQASTSSYRVRASPSASKPGPRLALVAGTRTRTAPSSRPSDSSPQRCRDHNDGASLSS